MISAIFRPRLVLSETLLESSIRSLLEILSAEDDKEDTGTLVSEGAGIRTRKVSTTTGAWLRLFSLRGFVVGRAVPLFSISFLERWLGTFPCVFFTVELSVPGKICVGFLWTLNGA
jgi:hypothetical protein